jgi:hypothetical protein
MRALTCFAAIALLASRPAAAQTAAERTGGGLTRVITVGQALAGKLDQRDALSGDSTYVQSWSMHGQAGRTITIELVSADFDAYVMLRGPGITGSRDYADDDSAGRCNARLTVTFPHTGEYEIIVNTTGKLETGSFSLAVLEGSRPKSLTRCNRDR